VRHYLIFSHKLCKKELQSFILLARAKKQDETIRVARPYQKNKEERQMCLIGGGKFNIKIKSGRRWRRARGEKDKVASYLDLYVLQDARTHIPSQPASGYYGLSALLRAEALCAPQMFADIKK
jgi:hypothetical protein